MEQTVEKKGLSKGCMVGLIVGGVLLVMIVVAAVTCYVKRDDLAKFGAATVLGSAKDMLAKDPVPSLDTTAFNATVEAFVMKLNEEPLDAEAFAAFFQKIQSVSADDKIDSIEAVLLMEAMHEYFPGLERFDLFEMPLDTTLTDETPDVE